MLVPLPIYPWPLAPHVLDQIRAAFLSLNAPFAVQPTPAAPGNPGRVLSLGSRAPFLCDTIVAETPEPTRLAECVHWVLNSNLPDDMGETGSDWICRLLGAREVTTGADQFDYQRDLEENPGTEFMASIAIGDTVIWRG